MAEDEDDVNKPPSTLQPYPQKLLQPYPSPVFVKNSSQCRNQICNAKTDQPALATKIHFRRREECERKARRGEMDPRLEFAFQLLIDATGLPRHEIMDHVFDGNMLDEINQLFLPHMRNKLMWFYQDVEEIEQHISVEQPKASGSRAPTQILKSIPVAVPVKKKKLFLTDGWDIPLSGICIYMFRLNITKQLPEEGFHKDLYCGILDSQKIGLVTAIERIVEHVYMEALAYPSPDCEDESISCPMIKNQLLPGLRSFCSALKVCEEVCDTGNVFDDGQIVMAILSIEEVKEMSKRPSEVVQLENRVKAWVRRVAEVLKESEQIRKENDSSGPQDELEYWKKRGAQFSQTITYLESNEVQLTILCLELARSKLLKAWLETSNKITFCYNEAKDNAKFIQAMEKNCHSLYLDDPMSMQDSILGLLQTVRLIHSVSQFYNTSERISSLMVKITNQMIETCKEFITCRGKETIWTQERAEVRNKLTQCVMLNRVYQKTYSVIKSQPFIPDQEPFNFSQNYVFEKFNTFCNRLCKIIAMFDLIDDYNNLFKRRMEGLLLGEVLEEAIQTFEEIKAVVMNKKYDYLDHRNGEFDADFNIFMNKTDVLKGNISTIIEKNFESVWETPQGIRFLTRFEKVSEKIPLTTMEDKYTRVLKYCEQEVDRIIKMFKKERDDPPLPFNFPPIAGRIKWARSLVSHLQELMECVSTHHVLKTLPITIELNKRYQSAETMLKTYESDMIAIWMSQKARLQLEIFQFNFSKLQLPLPMVALTLLSKRDHFTVLNDSLQLLINNFMAVVQRVKLEVRPLFLPQLVRLVNMLTPGLKQLTWVDINWKPFITNVSEAIDNFNILVNRVHDVYSNRILEVLSSMQSVSLHVLPEGDTPWSVDDFIDKIEATCRAAATELHRKSLMVEEAVEEVLLLVRNAAQNFQSTQPDEFDFLKQDDNELQNTSFDTDSSMNQQQSDWSVVWECFDKPHILLASHGGGLSKTMQDLVRNAVGEMRRYYSRKVIDVLVRVTRQSLEVLRKRFALDGDPDDSIPVFLLHATLLIPKVTVLPTLDEVQDTLITAGSFVNTLLMKPAQNTAKSTGWKKLTNRTPNVLQAVVSKMEQHSKKNDGRSMPEDFRTRRRRLYRLHSEKRPEFPYQQRNFYTHVMDNKDIIKTLSLLSTCTHELKPVTNIE
ncbi:Dynein heavy chain 1 [Carabus blaptoides fortunei]